MTDAGTPTLATVLEAEKVLLRRFLEALAQEHEELLAGNAEQLQTLAGVKGQLASALEATEVERRRHWQTSPRSAEIQAAWSEVRELGAQAAQSNLQNGAILSALTRHVEGALRIFTGAEEPFYGPAGGPTKTAGSRPLASA